MRDFTQVRLHQRAVSRLGRRRRRLSATVTKRDPEAPSSALQNLSWLRGSKVSGASPLRSAARAICRVGDKRRPARAGSRTPDERPHHERVNCDCSDPRHAAGRGVGIALVGAFVLLLAAPAIRRPARARRPLGRFAGPGVAVQPEFRRMGERAAQPSDHHRRPMATDRDARASSCRSARPRCGWTAASSSRSLQLDDDTMRFQLHSGSVAARLRSREVGARVRIAHRRGAVSPESAGRYRFDRIDDTSHVTAWRGQVLFEGHGCGRHRGRRPARRNLEGCAKRSTRSRARCETRSPIGLRAATRPTSAAPRLATSRPR